LVQIQSARLFSETSPSARTSNGVLIGGTRVAPSSRQFKHTISSIPTAVVSHPVVALNVGGNGRRVPGAGAPAAIANTPGPARPASGGPTPPAAGASAPREPWAGSVAAPF